MLHSLRSLLNDTPERAFQLEGFAELRAKLGGAGASLRAAEVITGIIISGNKS